MTKSELIAELAASNPHLRQADVELIVATIFNQITAALARGDRVELRGFGAFTVKQRDAHLGHNPRTDEVVSVKAKTVPFFKAGVDLRRRLNRSDAQGRPGRPAQSGQRDVASASAMYREVDGVPRPPLPSHCPFTLAGLIVAPPDEAQ